MTANRELATAAEDPEEDAVLLLTRDEYIHLQLTTPADRTSNNLTNQHGPRRTVAVTADDLNLLEPEPELDPAPILGRR